MYLKIKRNQGESDKLFENRKQKIKSSLDNMGVKYEEFTGAIDVIASNEAKFRLDYLLEERGLKFSNDEAYNKALEDLKYEIGDSDMLDVDYIERMSHWVLDREEHDVHLIRKDEEQ